MADLTLGGVVVDVLAPDVPTFVVDAPDADNTVVVLPVPGPPGPTGSSGGASGQPRFNGAGAPSVTPLGANPGDLYLDVLTGDLYRLD